MNSVLVNHFWSVKGVQSNPLFFFFFFFLSVAEAWQELVMEGTFIHAPEVGRGKGAL